MGIQFDKCCALDKLTKKGYIKPCIKPDIPSISYDSDDILAQTNDNIPETPMAASNLSDDDRNKIIKKFKRAVTKNNYLDAMYLIETYNNALDLTNIIFNDGNNVLHYSVDNKNSIFTIFLLQNGLDINIQNTKTGNTPLHISVDNNDVRMTAILIKWKANISAKNKYGQTPLDIAMGNNDADMVDLLTDDDVKMHYLSSEPSMHDYGVKTNKAFEKLYLDKWKQTSISSLSPQVSDETGQLIGMTNTNNNNGNSNANLKPALWDFGSNQSYHRKMSTLDENEEVWDSKKAVVNIMAKLDELAMKRHESMPSFSDLPTINDPPTKVKAKSRPKHRQENSIADEAIEYVKKKKNENVEIIQGWIERKGKYHRWKKKYLCIKDGYMLWNDKRIKVKNNDDIVDKTEKAKWKGHISLLFLKENGIKRTDVNKFEVHFKSYDNGKNKKTREVSYQFKCLNDTDIAYWINGINKHVDALKGEYNW